MSTLPAAAQLAVCCNIACCLAAGVLFQYPGALISSLAGIGASRFLRDPPAWLHAVTSGGEPLYLPSHILQQ